MADLFPTGIGQTCHTISGIINIVVSYTNEYENTQELAIKAHIVKNLNYQLIIGKEIIRQYNLTLQFPRMFLDMENLPRYWDFSAGQSCGRTTVTELRDTYDSSLPRRKRPAEDKLHLKNARGTSPTILARASSQSLL